ncbi:17057_t:CDS:2 [Racocetra persica]|uniref:17057_t:CDS:1 n=1 Tax=Racocetra persica TaxID=160502 RepID=A0ACA9KL38_9GLOM|nr:17057_t:CDS:2 [Racocetra persica]
MNPITFNEYEVYKEAQKKVNKDMQWHEFLKLDKKQYLNFRFNEANSIFPISEADFILHEWLTSYCNRVYVLPKKNIKPPLRRHDVTTNNVTTNNVTNNVITNNINAESALNQSDMDETNNSQDSLDVDQEKIKLLKQKQRNQSDMDEADNAQDSLNVDQEKHNKVTEVKAKGYVLLLKKNVKPRHNSNTNSINIESDHDQSDTDDTDNAQDSFGSNNNNNVQNNIIPSDNVSSLKNVLRSSQKHGNIKNVEPNKQNSGVLDEIGMWKEKKEAEGKGTGTVFT